MTVTSQLHAILCSYLWLNIGHEESRGFKEELSGWERGGGMSYGERKKLYCSLRGHKITAVNKACNLIAIQL